MQHGDWLCEPVPSFKIQLEAKASYRAVKLGTGSRSLSPRPVPSE